MPSPSATSSSSVSLTPSPAQAMLAIHTQQHLQAPPKMSIVNSPLPSSPYTPILPPILHASLDSPKPDSAPSSRSLTPSEREEDKEGKDYAYRPIAADIAASQPASKHSCQWVLDEYNPAVIDENPNVCTSVFDTAAELYEHLTHEHGHRREIQTERPSKKPGPDGRHVMELKKITALLCRWRGCRQDSKAFVKRNHFVSHCRPHDLKKHVDRSGHNKDGAVKSQSPSLDNNQTPTPAATPVMALDVATLLGKRVREDEESSPQQSQPRQQPPTTPAKKRVAHRRTMSAGNHTVSASRVPIMMPGSVPSNQPVDFVTNPVMRNFQRPHSHQRSSSLSALPPSPQYAPVPSMPYTHTSSPLAMGYQTQPQLQHPSGMYSTVISTTVGTAPQYFNGFMGMDGGN
ncbi:hypothetical protein HDU97_002085 [Phlyctochytrium planicorne]|nr:hypothetical protein HDU97_002085 [Phlyctochytrium planicorne]